MRGNLFEHLVREEVKRLREINDLELKEFADSNGDVELFHYSNMDSERLFLNPNQKDKSVFARRDYSISDVPRIFFYVDPREKEKFFQGHNLYYTKVPLTSIVAFKDIPEDVVKDSRIYPTNIHGAPFLDQPGALDMDKLLKTLSKTTLAYFYSTGSFKVVVVFDKIEVLRVPPAKKKKLEQFGPESVKGKYD